MPGPFPPSLSPGCFWDQIPIRAYRSARLAPGKVSQVGSRWAGWRSHPRNLCRPFRNSENARNGIVSFGKGRLLLREVFIPSLGVPDLGAGTGADNGKFPSESRILPERRWNSHAPLLVRYLVRGSREKNADVVTCLLGGDWSLQHLLVDPRKFLLAEDVDATLLAPCKHQAAGKLLAELSGENDPSLFIQTRRVIAKNPWTTACPPSGTAHPLCCNHPLMSSTLLHFPPQSTQNVPLRPPNMGIVP